MIAKNETVISSVKNCLFAKGDEKDFFFSVICSVSSRLQNNEIEMQKFVNAIIFSQNVFTTLAVIKRLLFVTVNVF